MPILLVLIIVVLLLVIAGTVIAYKKKEKAVTDYRAFFVMGIIWFAVGFPLENYAFSVLGFVFMVIGLINKKKWKERPVLTVAQRWILFGLVLITFAVTLIVFFARLYYNL